MRALLRRVRCQAINKVVQFNAGHNRSNEVGKRLYRLPEKTIARESGLLVNYLQNNADRC